MCIRDRPYASDRSVTFVDQNNQSLTYNLLPDINIREQDDGACLKTIIQPLILLQDDVEEDFLRIWLNFDEDLLGDREQLWGILYENGSLAGSGALTDITVPNFTSTTVNLNGTSFNDVITLNLNSNQVVAITLFLQKDVGLIGFDYMDSIWVVE